MFNVGTTESSRGQTGGNGNNTYASSINIRGISPYATLTLIDGRPMVQQEPRAEISDPSHVPTNMLQRVEIIADGGSAIYGAEAIAGVANLIMRRKLEGGEWSVRYGDSTNHAREDVAQLTWGHVWDSGQITMGFEHAFRSHVQFTDLDFVTRIQGPYGGTDIRPNLCNPGTVQVTNNGVLTNYPIPVGGVTPATADRLVPGPINACEYYKTSADARPQQIRDSFAFTFDQQLTDRVSLFAEGYASHRDFRLYNTPVGATLTVPSTNAYFVAPAGVTPPLCSAAVVTSLKLPTGTRCMTVQYSYYDDIGIHNPVKGFSKVFEITAGGKVKLPHDWLLTTDVTYGWDSDYALDRSYARINTANLNAALVSSNPATALNVFGGPNPRAIIDARSPTGIFNQVLDAGGHTIITVASAKIDGPLFRLPGGQVRAAVGARHYEFRWWSNNGTGLLTDPSFLSPQHVIRRIDSVFGEVNVPLIGDANALPMVQALELNAAGRIDRYNDIGTTSNPKVGVKWVPVDGLNIHGSYGTSFRSPNVFDIYGGTGNLSVVNQSNPAGGTLPTLLLTGGNPGIQPETAKTYSLGFDFNPSFARGLRIGVNYFDLNITNQVVAFGSDPAILSKEAQLAGTGVITRNPSVQLLQSILAGRQVTGGTLPADLSTLKLFIDGRALNIGKTRASGYDLTGSYDVDTAEYGRFRVGFSGIYFSRYTDQIGGSAAVKIDHVNKIFFPPKFRARYYLDWNKGGWTANLTANYLNAYDNTLVTPVQRLKATTTVDFRLAYDLGALPGLGRLKASSIAFDMQNVFNRDPNFVLGDGTGVLGSNSQSTPQGGAGYDPTKAFVLGRTFGVTLSGKF